MSNNIIDSWQTFWHQGAVVASGTLTINDDGTSNAKTVYSDDALTVTQSNPYTLNAYGQVQADLKWSGLARYVLKDSTGAILRTVDNVATLTNSSASATAAGLVELATDAETVTGSDTTRATTPANITAKMAAPGAIGGTTESTGKFTTLEATDTTQASSSTTGAIKTAGGISSQKQVYAAGDIITDATLIPKGDTASGDAAAVGYNSADGLVMTGQGSTNDWVLRNDADSDVIRCPTGTVAPVFAGIANFAAAGLVFDDETLDTYDEGTFTPVLSDGSNSATMGATSGTYTRIGNTCFFSCRVVTTSLGSVSGDIRVTGLPFTSGTGANGQVTVATGAGLAITASVNVAGDVVASSSYIRLQTWDLTTGTSNMQESEWTADGDVTITGQYQI